MKFEKALNLLKQGYAIKREEWADFCLVIYDGTIFNVSTVDLDDDLEAVIEDSEDEDLNIESEDLLANDWEVMHRVW